MIPVRPRFDRTSFQPLRVHSTAKRLTSGAAGARIAFLAGRTFVNDAGEVRALERRLSRSASVT